MRFIYFTDIHLCEGHDSRLGFERCLDSMLDHDPQLLVCGGDLGITPEAVDLYREVTRGLELPILLSNGNHEMCSGYLPREQAGTVHEQTPIVLASHVPVSTTYTLRMGQTPGMDFPTNEVANAARILDLLKPFAHVATLHGHDHENCRHFVEHIEITTTAAVAGNWWRNGLDSRCGGGREPQGYRLVEIDNDGSITSRYIAYTPEQDEPAEAFRDTRSGRAFVNVYDASPKTVVEVDGIGPLEAIDPQHPSSAGLATHLYELPQGFDSEHLRVLVNYEDGRVEDVVAKGRHLCNRHPATNSASTPTTRA